MLCLSNNSQVMRQYLFYFLPDGPWMKDNLPLIREDVGTVYLKKKSGCTKYFRTGVRLCQCEHLYDVEVA